ncbi:MAG TPA: response regulator [Gemmatimonadetes bacterium]|nr:response regulator [Gemmatimonadota bacterium]
MAQPVWEDSGDVLARNLRKTNWTVDLAENGRAALDRLAQARPDVILLDLGMSVMDGFSFLEHKRENDDWDGIPVIVVTATTLSAEERRRLNGASRRC